MIVAIASWLPGRDNGSAYIIDVIWRVWAAALLYPAKTLMG